jgi:1-deoxy-D-xylulose-5-phosphate synthase
MTDEASLDAGVQSHADAGMDCPSPHAESSPLRIVRARGVRRPARRERPVATSLLERASSPRALQQLQPGQLPQLAEEMRRYLVNAVAGCGGHLAASLGVVELAIALHYVFDSPRDPIIWDVGHQAYPHKILTGRREGITRIRRSGGLSGFMRREESAHDAFGAGHSSTSISAALGFALAAAARGETCRAIAVIGDGALTAGMAFEAMEHAGSAGADLLVVLNDNDMSISPNVGALHEHLLHSRALAGAAATLPVQAGALFKALGFAYSGPVDGHDMPALLAAVTAQRSQRGPRLLHVVTRKGQGYAPAENDPIKYHGVAPFDPSIGIGASAAPPTYTQIFGDWLCETAAVRRDIVAITPAMREGSGLVRFAAQYPERYIDVGIAEQHAVTLAAGMACGAMRPVVAIYSTFLQRAYDQLIHDVAIQRLPVMFAIDRAGLVGPDGATHNGAFDLSYLRCVPGLTLMAPSDAREMRAMLDAGLCLPGPSAVRYPREAAAPGDDEAPAVPLEIGRAVIRRQGRGLALLVFGTLLATASRIAEDLDATVVDMRFVAPLDARAVLDAAASHDLLVTIEENVVTGGAGSAVNECLLAYGLRAAILNLGLPPLFTEHGTRQELLRAAGLDETGIREAIERRLAAA